MAKGLPETCRVITHAELTESVELGKFLSKHKDCRILPEEISIDIMSFIDAPGASKRTFNLSNKRKKAKDILSLSTKPGMGDHAATNRITSFLNANEISKLNIVTSGREKTNDSSSSSVVVSCSSDDLSRAIDASFDTHMEENKKRQKLVY